MIVTEIESHQNFENIIYHLCIYVGRFSSVGLIGNGLLYMLPMVWHICNYTNIKKKNNYYVYSEAHGNSISVYIFHEYIAGKNLSDEVYI